MCFCFHMVYRLHTNYKPQWWSHELGMISPSLLTLIQSEIQMFPCFILYYDRKLQPQFNNGSPKDWRVSLGCLSREHWAAWSKVFLTKCQTEVPYSSQVGPRKPRGSNWGESSRVLANKSPWCSIRRQTVRMTQFWLWILTLEFAAHSLHCSSKNSVQAQQWLWSWRTCPT